MEVRHLWAIRAVIILMLVAGAVWLIADANLPTYRFELAVEVETPNGLRIGSSIVEVRTRKSLRILPDMGSYSTRVKGEAVAVALPSGQTLFATLVGENGLGYPEEIAIASLAPKPAHSRAEAIASVLASEGPAVVPRGAYPLLVRFAQPNRPNSAQGVNPDDLSASFGPGVRLRRIIVRRVDLEPTFTLDRRTWWGQPIQVSARASNGVGIVLQRDSFMRR